MKKSSLLPQLMLLFVSLSFSFYASSQVTQQWVSRYNGSGDGEDIASSLAVDPFGNVYVSGTSNGDYATIKYDSNGNELWVRRYNDPGNGNDRANAIAVDKEGNVYVTGESMGSGTNYDYVTIKYDANGHELWVQRYNGPANSADKAHAIAIDKMGNVFVTGGSKAMGIWEIVYDYATIKYDSDGNQLWVRRYDGPGSGDDIATSLAVDVPGNVYITGSSRAFGTDFDVDITTIKYDTNGNSLWLKPYNSHHIGDEEITAVLSLDLAGNVYVSGGSDVGVPTIKYDSNGNELWAKGHDNNNTSLADIFPSQAVDVLGNVYVTKDNGIIKYNSHGEEQWEREYGGGGEIANRLHLATDSAGNVYVTGVRDSDYTTIKYDKNGNQSWIRTFNGPGNGEDAANAIAVDREGKVYVTGGSTGEGTGKDYATINYVPSPFYVTGFTLINADNDQALDALNDGDTLFLSTLPTLNLNIRANTTPDKVDSVVFTLSGAESRQHTEKGAPYALFNDIKGDYHSWTPAIGEYTLTATPYLKGKKGDSFTIHFHVLSSVVTGFTLVNADNGQDIAALHDYGWFDLNDLPTLNLNIRANTTPATVDSVVFSLSGAESRQHKEKAPPYALFNDNNGDYNAWAPSGGDYTLTATPYLHGVAGTPLTNHFTVFGNFYVLSFALINADTDTDLAPLNDGDVVDLSTLPTINLNIRANVRPTHVGSVIFNLDGKITVENGLPYAAGGDKAGDYFAMTLTLGEHTLTATPYSEHTPVGATTGNGVQGRSHTIHFTVVPSVMTAPATTGKKKEQIIAKGLSATVLPNPSASTFTLLTASNTNLAVTVRILDAVGRIMEEKREVAANSPISIGSTYKAGTYYAEVIQGKEKVVLKLVKQ